MIRAVIFDLGGVVVRFTNAPAYYEHLAEVSGVPYEKVKHTVEDSLLSRLESGKMDLKAFERAVAKRLGIRSSKVEWYVFYKAHVALNYDTMELVRALHREYKTAFLSNVDVSRLRYTRKILDPNLFDYQFASCYMRERKPDTKIYTDALKVMRVKPDEAVFVDDRLQNVYGARRAGLHGIHFRNRRLLDVELAKLGL